MNLNDFTKGWIVGDFSPAILSSENVEVGIKRYKSGDKEQTHVHRFVDEWTIVVSGKIKMNETIYAENEIAYVEKGFSNKFECLEDSTIVVLKSPSIPTDKHLISSL